MPKNIYILFDDDIDPAMRYEGLARYAFDCTSFGDPDGYAHQSVFNFNFVPQINEEGLKILHKIIDALIVKATDEKVKELKEIRNSLSEKMQQMTGINLIDYLITVVKS